MNQQHLNSWKFRIFLLFGIGISNIGDWIYLIALNLIVLKTTHSPLAVALLYILKPLAALFTNVWTGSLIDRMNKRKLMIFLDITRAVLLFFLLFSSSLWYIYSVVILVNMASSIFIPASISYMAEMIPKEHRKQFNSFESLINSGAFLLGPALAGILFIAATPMTAVFVNAISFVISGLITLYLPDLKNVNANTDGKYKLNWTLIKDDWKKVFEFFLLNIKAASIYLLGSCVLTVLPSAIDSLEASFAKKVLSLSDSRYGFLVSIAGLGFAAGAVMNAFFVKKISTSFLISAGSFLVSAGYVIYSLSHSFSAAAAGFFVLSFFLAFANTGLLTFYQENIPIEIMGRAGSVFGLLEAVLIIVLTTLFGVGAQSYSVQLFVIIGATVMLILAAILLIFSVSPVKVNNDKSPSANDPL